MSVFVWVMWVHPRLYRNLYKIGCIAPGWIMGKKEVKGKGTTYYINYEYEVAGQVRKGKMQTNAAAYHRAHAGEAVHVLYHPNGGKRSIIYEYGGYRWE